MENARLRVETISDPESGMSAILSTKVLAGVSSNFHDVSLLSNPNSEDTINISINKQGPIDELRNIICALAIGSVAATGLISWIYNLEMLARTSK